MKSRVIPINILDQQMNNSSAASFSPACSVATYLENSHKSIFGIAECPSLIVSSLPYSYSLKKGVHFPWSDDARAVDSQCPNGTRMQITKLDDDEVQVEVTHVAEQCAWAYKPGYKINTNSLFRNRENFDELSILKRVAEIGENPINLDRQSKNSPRISVHDWNASCWYYRTKRTLTVPAMGKLDAPGLLDLIFQIQPILLNLLYAEQSRVNVYQGMITLMGESRKIIARRNRFWFYPLIHLADFLLKKVGINYDFVFYKVEVKVPSLNFSITYDHWGIPLAKNPLCNSAMYQSYMIQRFYQDKSSVTKFICPSWASSIEFLIR